MFTARREPFTTCHMNRYAGLLHAKLLSSLGVYCYPASLGELQRSCILLIQERQAQAQNFLNSQTQMYWVVMTAMLQGSLIWHYMLIVVCLGPYLMRFCFVYSFDSQLGMPSRCVVHTHCWQVVGRWLDRPCVPKLVCLCY